MIFPEDFYKLAAAEVKELKSSTPELTELFDYHAALLQARQETKSKFRPDLGGVDKELCKKRIANEFPLLGPGDVKIDCDLFSGLFDRISEISRQHSNRPESVAFRTPVSGKSLKWQDTLIEGLMRREKSLLDKSADESGISLDVFPFLACHTVAPFLDNKLDTFYIKD